MNATMRMSANWLPPDTLLQGQGKRIRGKKLPLTAAGLHALRNEYTRTIERTIAETMNTTLLKALRFAFAFGVVLWLIVPRTLADDARFFRIVGPTATSIAAFTPDGYITWTSAQIGTNYTVQTARSLGAATNWVDYIQVPVSNSVITHRLFDPNPPSGMAFIPTGSFTMGDTLDGESDAMPTNVTVSAFYMDTNLVSYTLWINVSQWATNHGYSFYAGVGSKAANHPVQNVLWYDAVKWCNARSQQAGLTPVYYTDAGLTQVYTNLLGFTLYANWAATGYRLPKEAEWEKAARGGLSGQRFPWGNTISESQANYYGCTSGCGFSYDLGPNGYNSIGRIGGTQTATSPVGSFAPNGYGLYDMAGIIWEWGWDSYGTPYGQPTTTNPTGPGTGFYRVMRGGDWYEGAYDARCASRNEYSPYNSFDNIGFRCVRGL